jgi:hypothetical protein
VTRAQVPGGNLAKKGDSIQETTMERERTVLRLASVFGVAALLALLPLAGATSAGEKEYLTVEEYVEQARPYLHLSCEGAWAEAKQEADPYIEIINKVTAIGFINHDFDVKKLDALPQPELEKVQASYYNEIGRLCGENPKRLLAGVVEDALVRAFTAIDPDAEKR